MGSHFQNNGLVAYNYVGQRVTFLRLTKDNCFYSMGVDKLPLFHWGTKKLTRGGEKSNLRLLSPRVGLVDPTGFKSTWGAIDEVPIATCQSSRVLRVVGITRLKLRVTLRGPHCNLHPSDPTPTIFFFFFF